MFSVSDTGIGIDPLHIPHLFKPFSQADGSTTRKFGGTGLGLSISKRLVELMAGEIGVESAPSKGSKFWFKLTLPVSSTTNNVIPIHRDGNKPRVLVLDGHASARHIMQTYIRSWNMECDVAVNGAEGLEMMQRNLLTHSPYDIVITDLLLPGIDGLRLKEEMSNIPGLANTKTILLTGYDMQDQGQAALKAGFCTHLTKPLEQSRLYNAISHVLTQDIVNNSEQSTERDPREQRIQEQRSVNLEETLILIAEDNPVNQKVATLQLKQLGLKCVAVPNGKIALEEYERGCYSLIIMDCQMPEMDGFQATQAIRERERESGTHIPIVGLTAYAMEGDRERCIAMGMDDYLSKPSTFEKLAAAMKQWLPHLAPSIEEREKNHPRAVAS
jgi:CheY-like chemotaxis protein